MGKGISIGIAADAKEFASGVKSGVIAPLEDADKAVQNIARDGSRLDELSDNMQDAQKATSKYERELQDVIDAQKKAARGSRDIGDESRDGFHKASENAAEFKDEARQNFSEVTSSFDGSMDSIVDLAQGTLGGLASSLAGPLGLLAGGAAAVLGGVFTAMSSSAQDNAEKAAQTISDMFDDMKESGDDFVSQDYVNQKIQEIIGNQEQLNKVKQDAAQASISQQTALRAEAGDQEALKTALEGAQDAYAKIRDRIDEVVKNGGQVSGELREQSGAAADLVQHYQDLAANQDTAKAKADLYRSATSQTAAAMADASSKAQGLANSINGIPRDASVKVNVDDAVAREKLRQLGKSINVDMFVTPRTGRGVN